MVCSLQVVASLEAIPAPEVYEGSAIAIKRAVALLW